MNLNFSNTLRRLRLEKSFTQEDVANRLGVSPQAISRWENGQSYPDIELIPRLALLYGATTDALFGIDRDTREGKRNAFWQRYEEIEDDDEALRHLEVGLTEFPDDLYLKRTLIRHYVGDKKHPISEKKLEQIREMVRDILAHSTDTDDRCYAVEMMIRVEDEDRLDEWTAHLPELDYSLWSCLAARYFYRNETDLFNGTHVQNLLRNLVNFCLGCGRRRDAKGDRLTVHCAGDAPIHYKTYLDRNPIALGIETLTRPTGWEWFNCVRGDAQYCALVERLQELKKQAKSHALPAP